MHEWTLASHARSEASEIELKEKARVRVHK